MTQPQTSKDSSPHAISWSWLRTCTKELYDLDEAPLFGSMPSFPWEQVANELSITCGIKNFALDPGQIEWKDAKNFLDGIKPPFYTSAFQASGVDGVAFFIMHAGDLQLLMQNILKMEVADIEALPQEFVDSFHTFLELQSINIVNQLGFDKKVSLKEVHAQMENLGYVLCQELWITCGENKISTFILLPSNFQKSWKKLYTNLPKPPISIDRLKEIKVSIQIEAGRVRLPYQELLEIKSGDFLLPDTDLYSPDDEKSRLLITFRDHPLFHAVLKDGSLKILEIPIYNEVQDSMQNKPGIPPSQKPDAETDVHNDHTDEFDHDPFLDEDEEDDDDETEDLDDDFDLIEEPPIKVPSSQKASLKQESLKKEEPTASVPKQELEPVKDLNPISPENIPMTVVIEVAQISMSIQKLLELQPGNLIDLGIFPENNVHLAVNGKIIGKGEILKIGETLGVRILEIGI